MRDGMIPPTLASPPTDIVNLDAVRDYPRLLAAFLAVLGILATAHGLIVSTRRRRPEMGVLRALGFSRRQTAHAVSAQGTTIGLFAVVVGVPLGLVAGRSIWAAHADRIGIGTGTPASVLTIALIAIGTVVLAWLLAAATGRRTSRLSVTNALRAE
jgi:ABC-type antimicrobial peptide transport system permease subunit